MVPDWKALLPHRPLDPDSDQYVPPPTGGAERIADWILADRTTVLVAGPVGIGKSTELARAVQLMHKERIACLIRLDRFENMRRATTDQLLLRIAGELVEQTVGQPFIQLSPSLAAALEHAGVLTHDGSDKTRQAPPPFVGSGLTILKLTLSEVSRGRNRRFALVLDGLEKMPDGANTHEFFEALGLLPDTVDIVAVLPWSQAFGAGGATAIRSDEHIVFLRAPSVMGSDSEGLRFLREILARRLQIAIPQEHAAIFIQAAVLSGGVPRTFLQLEADAGTYAKIRRKASWPDLNDLRDAVTEQRESFLRLLRPGDSAAILAAVSTDGRELDPDRKIRLLMHGVLLERSQRGSTEIELHPILSGFLHA